MSVIGRPLSAQVIVSTGPMSGPALAGLSRPAKIVLSDSFFQNHLRGVWWMDLAILKVLKDTSITADAIHDAISQAIEDKVLLPGNKLPSTREIAVYLGVSRTTVVKCFDTLIARGYLTSSQGSGTWVRHVSGEEPVDTDEDGLVPGYPWRERFTTLARNLTTLSAETVEDTAFDEMNFGAAPTDLVPVKQWRNILLKASEKIHESGFETNQEVFGYRPLREAIAGFLRRSKGIVCQPEQIVLDTGVQGVVSPALALLANAGDRVICENPGFYGAREQFYSLGADVLTVPVDGEGMIVDELASIEGPCQWLYIEPSCQEPTGVTLSASRRHQLLAWCASNQTAILEDDWDSEFHYGGQAQKSLFSLDKSGSVIYFYSFWRLLYPFISVGILVIPEKLIEVFESYKNVWDRQFTLLEHHVLTELINEGHVEKHIRSTWKKYRQRRQSLIFSLTKNLAGKIEIVSSSTGMHVLVRFDQSLAADRIEAAARHAGLSIASTTPYYVHDARVNEFMMRFTDIADDDIDGRVMAFSAAIA